MLAMKKKLKSSKILFMFWQSVKIETAANKSEEDWDWKGSSEGTSQDP